MSSFSPHINSIPKSSVDSTPKWYAIHTKFKTEKYVADNLSKKGIDSYVPLLTTTKRYVRKVRVTKMPLISCYIFVNITEEQKVKVLETEYVYRFVKQSSKEEAIPQEEIDILKRIVGEFEGEVTSGPITWEPGQKVEVIAGSLTGLKGKLISKKGKNLFVVELDNIGFELQMEIETKQLRALV